jgi:hypothetical protein
MASSAIAPLVASGPIRKIACTLLSHHDDLAWPTLDRTVIVAGKEEMIMTNHIRAHNTDADDKRRAADKAADAKQPNASPSQPKNAPERIPGQNIPVDQRKSPKQTSTKPEHDKTDEHYRASDSTGAGDFIAPGQKHPTSNTDVSKDTDLPEDEADR